MTVFISQVDGIGYDGITAAVVNPGILAGKKLKWLGQTVSVLSGSVANQGVGTVGCPALSAGATGTVTITDSLITTTSMVHVTVGTGTTTPAAGAVAAVVVQVGVSASGSVVVTLRNLGSAATLSTDAILWYWVIN